MKKRRVLTTFQTGLQGKLLQILQWGANEEELIEDSGLQMILVRCYEMHRETAKKRNNW
jgi:hypothetical protein